MARFQTGYNAAFFINKATRDDLIAEDPNSADIIKPLLIGDDVRRYYLNRQELFLIWTYTQVPIKDYPAIYRYLSQFQLQLEKRWDKGKYWWELRPCDYYADFEKPKIIYPIICMSSRFTFDDQGYFSNDKTFFIPREDKYLLALLNSRLLWQHFKEICSVHGDMNAGGRLELRAIHIETAPVRRIVFSTPAYELANLMSESQRLYRHYLDTGERLEIITFAEQLLTYEPEAADVLHDFLALLADEMLRLNLARQAEEKDFFDFIERTFNVQPMLDPITGKKGIDALSDKTTLLGYAGDYQKSSPVKAFEEISKVLMLKTNRKRYLLYQDEFKQAMRNLEMRYEQSKDYLEPLKQHLKATDELIDQIVYRLYGLTDEEIEIIEGIL